MSDEPITDDEALGMLSRFNASHWNNATEHARYSIPARPTLTTAGPTPGTR